ncbi:MAG: Phosphoglycerate mutase [Caulobacteraceae bacterium]|nr:Phosphoglycerate mutase [Caulobacteraceae bacterium]
MPRLILLVRHCQSLANAEGRLEGKGDSPLSESGREQARRVAAFVASQGVGAATLIASPLSRASATAAEIGALCGWTPSHDRRIRECEFGWMEDMSYADVRKHMAENQLTVLDHQVHGGETLDAIAARCWEALSEVLAGTDGPLIVVTHGYAIHALVEHRFGHELGLAQIANGDIIELWMEGDAVTGPPTRHALA